MPRKAPVNQSIYLDEAEGFILEHALFSPPRAWPPVPPEPQSKRLAATRKKMDWEEEVRTHPDQPLEGYPARKSTHRISISNGTSTKPSDGDGEVIVNADGEVEEDEADQERCVICLMALRDRTIVGVCGHEFCFGCIGVWANQSRRCPLCSADMAPFLLHDLDASTPTKFYLPPLPTRQFPSASISGPSSSRLPPVLRQRQQERDEREKEEPDELDLQVERRREIYRHELYVKHIGSNPTTRFRPNPTPRQISEDTTLVQRATAFLRRELRVWTLVDVEFLTTYIISLLKTIDIRSEPAVRLLADFLDLNDEYPGSPQHFAHELYSFLRCPYKELRRWDEVAQYDPVPSSASQRSRSPSRSRSRSPSRSLSPLSDIPRRSRSYSPLNHRTRSDSDSSSRSGSRPTSRDRDRGRKWSKRDTFVPSGSPDGKRWDEHDSWLDPEYAAWLDDERRRDEERRERKRARRASQLDLPERQAGLEPGGLKAMRAWGVAGSSQDQGSSREKIKVELLPDHEEDATLRMDDVVDDPGKMELGSSASAPAPAPRCGLSIRGAARSTDSTPTMPKSRQSLLDKLAKAKAEAETRSSTSGIVPTSGTISADAVGSTDQPTAMDAKKASLKDRLARAKAEAALARSIPRSSEDESRIKVEPDIDDSHTYDPSPVTSLQTASEVDIKPLIEGSRNSRTSPPVGLRAMVRARLSLKLKLETEKAVLRQGRVRQAVFESKAQELRYRLLQRKAQREIEEEDRVEFELTHTERERGLGRGLATGDGTGHSNGSSGESGDGGTRTGGGGGGGGGGAGIDNALRKMDPDERKKEIRRRLMRLKILSAETEGERKTRELKEKLLARKYEHGRPVALASAA